MKEFKAGGFLRRLNKAVAPNGWTLESIIDQPIWRYLAITTVSVAAYVGLRSVLGGPFSLVDWVLCSVFVVLFLAPALLRRRYLRRERLQLIWEQQVEADREAYERGYPDRSK